MTKAPQKIIANTRKELVRLAAESNSPMILRLIRDFDGAIKPAAPAFMNSESLKVRERDYDAAFEGAE